MQPHTHPHTGHCFFHSHAMAITILDNVHVVRVCVCVYIKHTGYWLIIYLAIGFCLCTKTACFVLAKVIKVFLVRVLWRSREMKWQQNDVPHNESSAKNYKTFCSGNLYNPYAPESGICRSLPEWSLSRVGSEPWPQIIDEDWNVWQWQTL